MKVMTAKQVADRAAADLKAKRFAVLDDDPDVLIPIDEDWYQECVRGGMHESNALELAVQAPFRVTWGFGAFENFATIEAALTHCNDLADGWGDDICGPEVLRRLAAPADDDLPFEHIHAPVQGVYFAEEVAA